MQGIRGPGSDTALPTRVPKTDGVCAATANTPKVKPASASMLKGQAAAAAQLRRAAQAGAARAEAARAPAGLTVQQRRLVTRLFELEDADDWRGVVALEKETLALAQELREAGPGLVGEILSVLGHGYIGTGDYGRAREMYEQRRAVAQALGDRAGVATASTESEIRTSCAESAGSSFDPQARIISASCFGSDVEDMDEDVACPHCLVRPCLCEIEVDFDGEEEEMEQEEEEEEEEQGSCEMTMAGLHDMERKMQASAQRVQDTRFGRIKNIVQRLFVFSPREAGAGAGGRGGAGGGQSEGAGHCWGWVFNKPPPPLAVVPPLSPAILTLMQCLETVASKSGQHVEIDHGDTASNLARLRVLIECCRNIEEACMSVAPTGYEGGTQTWVWTQTKFRFRQQQLTKWSEQLESGSATLSTVQSASPQLLIQDRFAALWHEACLLLGAVCDIHDTLGGLSAAGLTADDFKDYAQRARVAGGMVLVGKILYPGMDTLLDTIAAEYLTAVDEIEAAFADLQISGFTISVSFCIFDKKEMKKEGHSAVHLQTLAAKLHHAAGVTVQRESVIQVYHKARLPAWGGWLLESKVQELIIKRLVSGGGFGNSVILCNFTAVAYITRCSNLLFFNTATQSGLPTYKDPRTCVVTCHAVAGLIDEPPSSHPLILDKLTSFSLVATTKTIGDMQAGLRQALIPPGTNLRGRLIARMEGMKATSGMRYINDGMILEESPPVVAMDASIAKADEATKKAVWRIANMMPADSSTSEYLKRACNVTAADTGGAAQTSKSVCVPDAPAAAKVGAVSKSDKRTRNTENAMLRALVGSSPANIFDNPRVKAICDAQLGHAPARSTPAASRSAQGPRWIVKFEWMVDNKRTFAQGKIADTHEEARQNFWKMCTRAHAAVQAGDTPKEPIASHNDFLSTMTALLGAVEVSPDMAMAAGAR